MTESIPAFEMRNVTKRFPGVIANDDVTFTAERGEIHALLGENGAGKSTLMNVLSGLYHVDKPEVEIGESRLKLNNVGALDNKGLAALDQLSLDIRSGEIVGVAGVAGNGQRELAEVISGLRPMTNRTIDVAESDISGAPPLLIIGSREAMRRRVGAPAALGVPYVREERGA